MGKVLTEARGDVQEAINMAYYMAGEGRRMFGQTAPSEMRNKFQMSIRKPHGVVGVITPWNFPMAIPSWKIFPAIVSGNTVVFKPASFRRRMGLRFVEVLEEAGVPAGVVNLVLGSGEKVGDPIVDHPDVPVITFTGSTESGVDVATRAARKNKRVSLEMGGKNAVIVMDDANLELATEGILWSTWHLRPALHRVQPGGGAPLVQDELSERLAARASKMTLGYGLDPSVDVGPVVSARQLQSINGYIGVGKGEGARLVTGGNIATAGVLEKGHFHEPTIFDNVKATMRIAQRSSAR